MQIEFLENEYWYGGATHIGVKMPFDQNSDFTVDLITGKGLADQKAPFFFSTKGRYLYSDRPFSAHFDHGVIRIEAVGEVELSEGHGTLRGAQQALAKRCFTLKGEIPNEEFLRVPQYNTWIELMYNQNQKQILEYAHALVDAGMKPGVLMIDEGWAPDYGVFDFCPGKFSDPRAMVKELHDLGFRVMLWITPHISPDGDCFRDLRDTNLLIRDKDGEIAIRKWWNGYSCVLDLSNPEARDWFRQKLDHIMEVYGVDGFKFDSADSKLYDRTDSTAKQQERLEHTREFDTFAAQYEFNELRSVYGCPGLPLVCRLQDKLPRWVDDSGFNALLPNMLVQGLTGYFYGCPDMIGGGAYSAFKAAGFRVDEELYLRWLEASVLCPMMQFSISPKRVLTDENMERVFRISKLHEEYADRIVALAKNAAVTGEPIMRLMEYEFPEQGFEAVVDQFMLGSDTLVAPVMEPGVEVREVKLPKGKWQLRGGDTYTGGRTVSVYAPIDVLPVFTKI